MTFPRPTDFQAGDPDHASEHNRVNEHLNLLHQATERTLYGTGDPNGVHAAPVGSVFRNTEAGGWNGARVWRKDTGTGNTGWVVESGDTGWRDVSSFLMNGWEAFSGSRRIHMRRVNATVYFQARLVAGASVSGLRASSTSVLTFPPTFGPGQYVPIGLARGAGGVNAVGVVEVAVSANNMDVTFSSATGNWTEGDRVNIGLSYAVTSAWPDTLPPA